MLRKISLSLALCMALNSSPYTMYASKAKAVGDMIYADGSVVIYHDKSVYKADKAVYNKKTKLLKLLGNVTAITQNSKIQSDSLDVKTDKKDIKSDKFFVYDASSGLWIRGSGYRVSKDVTISRNSEVSSCGVKNPDWKILFAKAKYNKKIDFLSLYRPTFYFKDVPVFALPWFGFSTLKKRHSGLLRPLVAIKVDSGVIYSQPYFYAPYKNWDLEVIPQIRTKRGYGVYSTLRFADTANSRGSLRVGEFWDKKSYQQEQNLKNDKHYGFDFSYKSTKVFDRLLKDESFKDGMWIDFHYLNDIDYENLKQVNFLSLNKLITSRYNYYLKNGRDYAGMYAKYFIDTSKVSNRDTMQELPTLQFHRFTSTLPIKNLIYSADFRYKNNYRRKGLNAEVYEVNLPLKFDIPLWDNYLNFSLSENLFYSKVKYSKTEGSNIEDAKYFSNYHKFVLSSDLTKPYQSFLHNLQLEAALQVPSFEDKSGYFADFIHINKEEKNLNLSVNQYFYDYHDRNFLTIRSNEQVLLKKDGRDKYGDIFNEIIYNYSKNLSFHENINYSNKYNKLSKIQSNINYHDDIYNFSLSHTFEDLEDKDINYFISNVSVKLPKKVTLSARLDYDIETKLKRSWSIGYYRDRGCWNYSIKYKQSNTPILTSGGAKSYKNKGLYFLVNFANIGGVSYEYTKDDIVDSGVKDE